MITKVVLEVWPISPGNKSSSIAKANPKFLKFQQYFFNISPEFLTEMCDPKGFKFLVWCRLGFNHLTEQMWTIKIVILKSNLKF